MPYIDARICALRCVVPVQGRLIGRLLVNHSPWVATAPPYLSWANSVRKLAHQRESRASQRVRC